MPSIPRRCSRALFSIPNAFAETRSPYHVGRQSFAKINEAEYNTFRSYHFNAMPPTALLRLSVCALLLLLCSSLISCFRNKWKNCSSVNTCGNFNFSYPFGKRGSGCGDHYFQLGCDPIDSHPLLRFRGTEYHILKPYLLGNNSINHSIIINNDNLLKDKCKLLDNYTQPWWYDYKYFQMARGYNNLTFWRDCNQNNSFVKNDTKKLSLCGNVWYYSFSREIELNGPLFCKTYLQLPIKKEVLRLNKSVNDQTFLKEGFEIIWQADRFRDQNCGACLASNGKCGYNHSTPFLCYCPNGTTQLDNCYEGRNKSGGNKSAIIIGCSIGGPVLLTAALAVLLFMKFYVKERKTFSSAFTSGFSQHKRKDMKAARLSELKICKLPTFSYQELCQATNCFHEENEVGDGGFGLV